MPRKGELRTDLSGQRFGRLTVVKLDHRNDRRKAIWLCRCDCGETSLADGNNLRSGNSESCGCLRREQLADGAPHGHAREGLRSPEYQSWAAMWARCRATDPMDRRFRDYVARGITVCERWRSFETFLADMGPRPAGTSIDRIDNDRGYEPGNCRWATDTQQNLNKRRGSPPHPTLSSDPAETTARERPSQP
jgi:hypothetical protein